jgi:hypothetical protein
MRKPDEDTRRADTLIAGAILVLGLCGIGGGYRLGLFGGGSSGFGVVGIAERAWSTGAIDPAGALLLFVSGVLVFGLVWVWWRG